MVEEKGLKDVFATFFEDPSRESFRELIRNSLGESREVEFKREWLTSEKLAKQLLGFANSRNGCLIFGLAEAEEAQFEPVGLKKFKDKADIEQELRNYLPSTLLDQIKTLDFSYETSEYEKLIGKKFQVMVVDYRPEYIPFVAVKNGDKLSNTTIYCRREGSTAPASYDELQRILNSRLEAGNSTGVELTSKEHLKQLKALYNEIPSRLLALARGGILTNDSIDHEGETYRAFILKTIKRKKGVIEAEFGIKLSTKKS